MRAAGMQQGTFMYRKLKRTLALAALLASSAGVAHATEGWYGRIDAGSSIDGEVDNGITTFDLEDDWMASLGAGYGFANGFRLEGAVDYRNNDLDPGPSDAELWSAMA